MKNQVCDADLDLIFKKANLPKPDQFDSFKIEAALEELSGAVEVIGSQLEERSEPLPTQTKEEHQQWVRAASSAFNVKNKQIEALTILKELRLQKTSPHSNVMIRRKGSNAPPTNVYYKAIDPTITLQPRSNVVTVKVAEPLIETTSETMMHLDQCVQLLNKIIVDEKLSLYADEIQVLLSASKHLAKNL